MSITKLKMNFQMTFAMILVCLIDMDSTILEMNFQMIIHQLITSLMKAYFAVRAVPGENLTNMAINIL